MEMALILTNCPDADTADRIAEALIGARLAACANRYAPIISLYHWQGAVAKEEEVPLLIKTRADLAERAAAEVRRLHPYEVPAILRIPVAANADFLDWIGDETTGAG